MKTEVWVSYSYGGTSLVFSKEFQLPFAPFFGMQITIDKDGENYISLDNDDYTYTVIQYDPFEDCFLVNVRNTWKRPVTEQTVDEVLEQFSKWKRQDSSNIQELKDLMKRNYEEQNRR